MVATAVLRRLRSSPRLRLASTAYVSYGSAIAAASSAWFKRVQDPNRRIAELAAAGRVCDARRLFDGTPDLDVVSWTALVASYARQGMLREARELFDRPDARRNVVTWTALLSGYARTRRVDEAQALFERMPERNVVSWNTMLEAYAMAGRVGDACLLFDRMPVRDAGSWNILLAALVRSGSVEKARKLFDRMPERDVMAWTTMVAGIARNGNVDEARVLFDGMPERNVVSWNAMISGYTRNKRIDEALDLFVKMPMRDIASWNIMITGFIQNKDLKRARELFNEMPNRNVVTWTTMMNGYLQGMQSELALKLFSGMLIAGIRPNQVTFLGALDACSNLAALCEGQQVHQMICKTEFQFDTFVESTLMNVYAKCGEIRLARKVFDLSREKDLVSWNGIIAAYAHHGVGIEAIRLYEKMQENGYKPNDVTYVVLLSACSHSGLVDEGLKIFESMVKDRSTVLRDEHYTCLIDICSRAGRLDDAKRLIQWLKIKPTSGSVWSALLGGCNAHGNESIGNLAARNLLEAEPDNAGTYTLLSNIYASAGKWKEAAEIRSEMNNRGLKKQPGCSWIEVANRVHVFVSRDKSHSESDVINGVLQDVHHIMRLAGTVPRDHVLVDEELVAI
ncbi:pentatricopeptide repeat-containing protein At2g35030, mitochondrial [Phragmites australis]|uniref:pentatricopeptide repeat-containing protein At2g35030, mitochondrial n=1 Tax=Phragmites australis TaxID=29695 RepID=UPI002D78D646|nr:pentatricopeptide repeat-containing protein At2g35030, mitochondrial [Phragmites australis]